MAGPARVRRRATGPDKSEHVLCFVVLLWSDINPLSQEGRGGC